ncbi:kinetochore-associated protein 1 isoform X1 [Monodelphis domestica]|uniref:kinetochore-associated protein 1 isoform X1 n=2 Tax=Monodelphis domestica TaxID=13616 RepID=UPI0024E1E8B2|nr:kinetochore-associated protein 1 isoform X1 [Monodelphis domestica]XP_007489959.2 kinetochore-associated protein 1 isoform X1 [Monodelphis domestica]
MWDDIELLTSDDTGSGCLSIGSGEEHGTTLYQVDTLVKISSEKASFSPKLHACSSSDGFVIVVDQSVTLFDNICRSLQLHLQFDTKVDVVGLCQGGEFLLVGERSGNLHLIHVTSNQTLLTNAFVQQAPDENQCTYQDLIIEEGGAKDGKYHVFLLTYNGLFCIMDLQLTQIQEAIEKKDFIAAKELQGQTKTSFITTENYHDRGCLSFVIGDLTSENQVIIGGTGDFVLSKWELDPENKVAMVKNFIDSDMIKGAKKIQLADNLLFILDTMNVLSLWDIYTLIPVWNWPCTHFEDFILTTEADSSSSVTWEGVINLKLIALTTSSNQMRNLMVYSLPTMTLLYSLEVSAVSSLVRMGISSDTIYLLEGIYENDHKSPEGSVSMIVLRCLTEALPENRLSRLLHKHKFTEAENFAISFGLDVELVYKVKSNDLLERMALCSVGTHGPTVWQQLVDEAKESLCKIQDDQFVVDYCLKAQWPTFETTQEMLNYAKVRLLKKEDKIPTTFSNGLTEVLKARAKLATFYGAFGPEKFSGNSWIEFLKNEDILKDIYLQLKEGNLFCAQFLWLRHRADFESRFNVNMLDSLLSSISTSIPMRALCLWLQSDVIPFVKRILPEGQGILAKWLEQAARNLELTDKANWPENGLEVAQVFFTSENPDSLGLISSCHCISLKDCENTEEICHLRELVNNLQELIKLYRKYNCKLALSEFEKENTTTIVFRMLDKVLAPELIPSILEKYVKLYMKEYNLEEEPLLLLYIKDMLERYSCKSASLFETSWESKAMAIIGCLSDTDLIFDAVLQIMYGAVVPWSTAVEQLVKKHLEMDHPKVKLLQESYKLMEMKKLLRGYGIRDTNLLNKEIMRVIRYILKQDGPTSLEDALKVAQAYLLSKDEIYSLRVIDLMSREQGEECLYLLKSLPPAEAEKTAERVIIWARLVLQEEPDDSQEGKLERISIARTTVNIIKALRDIQKENPLKMDECEENLKLFKTIRSLQEDFELFLPFDDYRNHSLVAGLHKEPINSQEVSQPWQKTRRTPEETPSHSKNISLQSSLYRQTLCLLVSEQDLEAKVVLKALNSGRVDEALRLCRDLFQCHSNPNTGRVLVLACQKLCQMLGTDTPMIVPDELNLPLEIYQLACQAATVCSPDFLLDALEMCKYTLTAMEIYRQCQMEDCGTLTKTSFGADRDPYEEWTYNDFFSEDGIVLESQLVLPVIYELISSLIHESGGKRYPLDSASLPYCSFHKGKNLLLPIINPVLALLQNLQESSQWELALKFVVGSFGICLQHGMSNCMNISLSEKLYEEKLLISTKNIIVGMKEKSTNLVRENAAALLHKVFNCRLVDHDLALGYLTLLPKKDVFENIWKVINTTWQNYSKILAVSQVGAQLASLYKETEIRLKFQELITDAQWGLRLGKLGISFQPVFREHSLRKKELMSTLVQNSDVDTTLILEYCSTYDLDSDAALQLFIETLILHHNHIDPCEEDKAMSSLKQPHSKVLAKAVEIVPLLKSTRNLVVSLSGILHKLDPYDYEIIEVVLKIMQKADEKVTNLDINQGLSLMKHLKSYRRASPPGNLEHEYIMNHTMTMSSAAQIRLPFHLIFFGKVQNFWKILSAELREESFPTFLLIAKLMKVSLDSLYVSTVKQVFEKSLKPKLLKQVQAKGSTPNNKEIAKTFQTLQSYLLSIANPEWAVAVAINLAQDIPEGCYKITILKFCLYLAEKWLKNISSQDETHEKAEALLKKLRVQYQRSGTETVLITHGLGSPEHLRLLGKPAQLIASLYEHGSILPRIQGPADKDCPDIHAAAKEIAEINNLDLEKIWDVLLEKWLCPATQTNEIPSEFFNLQGDEALQRVLYLLQIRPIDYSSRMLFLVATSSVSPFTVGQLTFAYRRRALHCLLCLADRETIESLFKKPYEEVKCFLKCITFLAAFEMLNIPLTYESFHNSPKEGMIKGLWKNHSHEPMAVRLVTELSLEYKVYDTQLWSGLLQKLLGFNMISYLRNVLTAISNIRSLWQIPYFGRAWQRVSQIPLISASCPLNPTQLLACRESLVVLLECPVSMDLDMVGVAKQFSQLELPAFALACLLLMPHSDKRDQQLQNFLGWCNPEVILQQIDEHMNTGQLAGFACQVKGFILNHIINKKQFGILANTKYFPLLKLQVISTQKVKELVDYLVNNDSLDEASLLIMEYLKQCGKAVPLDITPCDLVKMFLSESK